jgi:DNA polymerase IV (DinB-like DNA polymerase)
MNMAQPPPRIIMHLDLDAFYPSVEIQSNPSLKDLPVIVGADPKGGKGRGVVLSASYEARRFGVHSGQPISSAFRLCPQGIFIRPNFHLYGTTSARVMRLLRAHCDRFEQTSIDEAFLDVTAKVGDYAGARSSAMEIKDEIRRFEGLSCTIGIAHNKSTAKIASDLGKPDGLVVVEPDRVEEFLAPLPVSAITGVGEKTKRFLKGKGIETIGQLQLVSGSDLVKFFGKGGVWLWGVAHGLEQVGVLDNRTVKSLSVEHTFDEDVSEEGIVDKTLKELSEELQKRIDSGDFEFKTVGIKIRFEHFQTFTREKTLNAHGSRQGIILAEAASLIEEFKGTDRKVRLIGIRVSNLRKAENRVAGLEAWMKS